MTREKWQVRLPVAQCPALPAAPGGHTPPDYARFLDYATERIFLRKVGGEYIFVHRLLLEYFADGAD